VVLAKPQTFMNLSGNSVSQLMKKYNLKPEDIIIIHDDLDLPTGKIRIRTSGSAGGHKGVASIINAIGTADFIRIKVGIGHPTDINGEREGNQGEVIEHVLGDFTPEERKTISETILLVGEAVKSIITEGVSTAMNKYNGECR